MVNEDDLGLEFEALQYTYPELVVEKEQQYKLSFPAVPRTAGDASQQFVAATLQCEVPDSYPTDPVTIRLRDVRGLSEAREQDVCRQLHVRASELAGEMMMGELCELILDCLTELNHPEGDCCFCLFPLDRPYGSTAGSPRGNAPLHSANNADIFKLPCFHIFHRPCFKKWWRWEQASLRDKAQATMKDLGHAGHAEIERCGLVPDSEGIYTILCPVCRTVTSPKALAAELPWLQAGIDLGSPDHANQAFEGFDSAELAQLEAMRKQHAHIFDLQKSRDGIVAESSSISLNPSCAPRTSVSNHSQQPPAAPLESPEQTGRQFLTGQLHDLANGRGGQGQRKPANAGSGRTCPAHPQPAVATSGGTRPAEPQPTSATSGGTRPAEPHPAVAKSGGTRPAHPHPATARTGGTRPAHSQSALECSGGTRPAQPHTATASSGGTGPAHLQAAMESSGGTHPAQYKPAIAGRGGTRSTNQHHANSRGWGRGTAHFGENLASGEMDGPPVLSRIDAKKEGGQYHGKRSGRKRSGSRHVPASGNPSGRDLSGSVYAPAIGNP